MARKYSLVALVIAASFGTNVFAEVTAEEAKQLGGPALTLIGAEKAGNKDGSIPEYKGETLKAPPGYNKSSPGLYPDPWDDKPQFTITAQNADKYADKLDGVREMFKKYPGFRMEVYPSRRTVSFPRFVLDNTVKNATTCRAKNNELTLEGCYGGYPFPIPKTGTQVIWNHLLMFETVAQFTGFETWVVTPSGTKVMQNRTEAYQQNPYYDPARNKPAVGTDLYWAYRGDTAAPARRVGEKLIVLDAVDAFGIGRRAYQYIPGQRRVKLAPDLAYDTPSPYGGGSITMDESKVFMGSPDRFEWKLIGKREKLIPYNNFKATDPSVCSADQMFTPLFPKPDCVRWELHRVWVVEGVLKPGLRHIYKRRVLFFDEDGYLAAGSEAYDAANALYRLGFSLFYPYYDGAGGNGGSTLHLDLQTGVYAVQGFSADRGLGFWPTPAKSMTFFSPEDLAGQGVR